MTRYKGTNNNDVLVGTLVDDDYMIGKGGNDTLIGDYGNDTLLGGSGDDLLEGLVGNDTVSYRLAVHGVIANLATQSATGEGNDTYLNVENLYGSTHADRLIGSDGDNRLDGARGADRLFGGDGADTLVGGASIDNMSGGAGNDVLIGGRGRDVMTGGGGQDSFRFDHVKEIKGDRIVDIDKHDRIDLSHVDADATTLGDQPFHMVNHFTHTAGDLRVVYDARHDYTKISGDTDGDGHPNFTILLDGAHADFNNFVM